MQGARFGRAVRSARARPILDDGQQDLELGAFADAALHVDPAADLLHDPFDGGQAEPGAATGALGAEERLEEAAEGLFVHPFSIIGKRPGSATRLLLVARRRRELA